MDTGTLVLEYAEGPPNGPLLLFLYGGSGCWRCARAFVEALLRGWRLFAPDLRGHGRSGWVPGSYRLRDYTGDRVAFLQQAVRRPGVLD